MGGNPNPHGLKIKGLKCKEVSELGAHLESLDGQTTMFIGGKTAGYYFKAEHVYDSAFIDVAGRSKSSGSKSQKK